MALSGTADLVGRVLAGRYRLLAPIGAGGSGRVYVADDVRLRRRVAVKVLHAALADDAGFLRRFRNEAQLAASLHHPNVMAVYDWGEDGVPFMVMELLVGGSLRGMLDHATLLTPSQAAHVGGQVCAALEYAHGRGLVHRDIKPANLLFDEHGIVRVADFGLARALAEASWTEPAGTVLGTARYAAPEQASGAPLDGRADLYALGLVLVESVTGHVPFQADTAIGTLAARTQQPVRAPEALGPLGAVVERAGRPDPAERYPDATTMRAAIADATRQLPPPGPLTLVGLGERIEDPNPTQLPSDRAGGEVFDQDADRKPVAVDTAPAAAQPRRSLIPFVIATVVVLALLAAALVAIRPAGGASGTPVTVPNLVGRPVDPTARDLASRAGLIVATETTAADDPAGTVIAQSPAAGAGLRTGGTIRLTVSSGPRPVAIPEVVGKPVDQAQALLGQAGFAVELERRYDEQVAKDVALATNPAKQAPRDSTVTLIVSNGPAPVAVPDVAGGTYDAAVAALQAKRITATKAEEFSDTVAAGTVIRTDPPAGTQVPKDSSVAVVVSKGPDLVAVPDVRGMSLDQASATLSAAGLQAVVQGAYVPGRKIRAQDPPAGTQVKRGTSVTLFL